MKSANFYAVHLALRLQMNFRREATIIPAGMGFSKGSVAGSHSVYFLPLSPLSQHSKKYTHEKVIGPVIGLFCQATASDWSKYSPYCRQHLDVGVTATFWVGQDVYSLPPQTKIRICQE